MINPAEVQVWWPIVVVLLGLAFAIGIVVGSIREVDRRVTRILRREMGAVAAQAHAPVLEAAPERRNHAPKHRKTPDGVGALSGQLRPSTPPRGADTDTVGP